MSYPTRQSRLRTKMRNRRYRHAYVEAHSRQFLAAQIRELRRELSQREFSKLVGKPQAVISRLECPSYRSMTLKTLFEIAAKLDIAVFVRFVDFKRFVALTNEINDATLTPKSGRLP